MDDLVDSYFDAKQSLHNAFGYESNWNEIPMEDKREMYWMIVGGEEGGTCVYSEEPLTVKSIQKGDKIYSGPIYTNRFIKKLVYRTPTHALISVDTQTDGNKFLMIFDATKECVDEHLRKEYLNNW